MLYKAKRKDNNEWVEGYYVKHKKIQYCFTDEETDDNIEHLIFYDGFADWNMPIDLVKVEVLPKTLCRKSPFVDKLKKRIFEGDYFVWEFDKEQKIHQVYFDGYSFKIRDIDNHLNRYELYHNNASHLKRIKNLYDKERL
jgi:hypothetical protein